MKEGTLLKVLLMFAVMAAIIFACTSCGDSEATRFRKKAEQDYNDARAKRVALEDSLFWMENRAADLERKILLEALDNLPTNKAKKNGN